MEEPTKHLLDLISQRTGFALEKLNDNLEFEQDLNLSHEELVDFITEIETKFSISFKDPEINEIKTVSDLKEILLDRLEAS